MAENVKDTVSTDTEPRNYRKTRQGYVVSDKMDKTVVVEVEDRVKHALYGKVMRKSHRVKGHCGLCAGSQLDVRRRKRAVSQARSGVGGVSQGAARCNAAMER